MASPKGLGVDTIFHCAPTSPLLYPFCKFGTSRHK